MSTFATPGVDTTLRLHDGRNLAYAEYGQPAGTPVFHFHGGGSTRLEAALQAEAATQLGVRLIGFDRPGIGRSDFQPGRRLLDWPDDMLEAADILGIERFCVEGASAGAPFALACAYKIPQRLLSCGVVSGMVPLSLITLRTPLSFSALWLMTQRFPWLLRWSTALYSRPGQDQDEAKVEKLLARTTWMLPKADKEIFRNPETRRIFAQSGIETLRQGAKEAAYESKILTHSWGFEPEEIAFEKVFLWYGVHDESIPISLARTLAQAIPHCIATFYPNEAHISTMVNHAADILGRLIKT